MMMTPLDAAKRQDQQEQERGSSSESHRKMARRIERVMHEIDQLSLDEERCTRQWKQHRFMIGMSALFAAVGGYVCVDGYRKSHPLWCYGRRFIKNNALCKFFQVPAMSGAIIATFSLYQIPGNYYELVKAADEHAHVTVKLAEKEKLRFELEEEVLAKVDPQTAEMLRARRAPSLHSAGATKR